MNRRELIKAVLPALSIPVLVRGQEVGKAFKIEKDAKYLVFINTRFVSDEVIAEMCKSAPLPPGTPVYPIYAGTDALDDVIRIYKV